MKAGWVSALTQISYLQPANVMEEVIIETRLINCTEKNLLLEALMWNRDKSALKAAMWAKLVHFNLTTNKSQAHSPELMQFFRQVVHPLPTDCNLEQRINDLKKGM